MSASTTPNQNASLSPHSEEPPQDIDSTSRNAPERKLTTLQRINSFIGKQEPPKFPPNSWTTEGISAGGAQGSDTVPEFVSADRAPTPTPPPDAPEAQTLANRIRLALASAVAPNDASVASPDGTPAPSMDERFKAWLSSDSVMNGAGATSVWAYLDNLNPMKPKVTLDSTTSPTSPARVNAVDSDDDADSLMMYGPLEPTEDSKVQIARSREVVDEDSDLPGHKESTPAFSSSDGKGVSDGKTPKGKVKKVWVPSPTQISLETAWWGYRIYLPPPVMERLNTYQPIAAKKAAVISTSLKWILDKVPTLMVPPPLRPALMLLKRLTPLLGSIGVFVAWSWGRISSQDKGHGVYLSATWLLPVALIPATWDPADGHLPATSEGAKKVDPSSQKIPEQAPETAAPAAETVESPTSTKGSIFSMFGSLKGKKKAE